MTSRRIILLTICVIAILVIGSVTATILYYHRHPSALKTMIERSVSASTGSSLTIGDLSFSISPLYVRAKNVSLEPGSDQYGFYAAIPDLSVDMVLVGRFGQKRLTVTNLKVADFTLRLSSEMALPEFTPEQETSPSFFSSIIERMFRVLVFRGVTFQSAEVVNGEISVQSGDQTAEISSIQARISPEQGFDFSCSASAESPGDKMRLLVPCLHVTSDHAIYPFDQEMNGRIRINEATLESAQGNIKAFDITSTFTYDYDNQKLAFNPVHIFLEGMTFDQEGKGRSVPTDMEFTAQGSLDLKANQMGLSSFHLASQDLLELAGEMDLSLGEESSVRVTDLDGRLFPDQCLSILRQVTGVRLPPVRLSGPVALRGNIDGAKDEQAWQWQGDVEVLLSRNRFSYATKQMRSAGRVSGTLRAAGSFPDMDLSVNLEGDETTFSGMGVTVKPCKARVLLTGRHPLHRVEEVHIAVPQATLAMEDRNIQVDDIDLLTKGGTVNAENGAVSLPEVRLTSSLLKNLRLSLHIDESESIAELKGEDTHLAEAALALGLIPPGWEFSGLDSLKVEAILRGEDRLSLTSKVGFKEFAFMDSEGNRMGEGILFAANSKSEIDLKRSNVRTKTNLNVDGGEVLWGNFYFDMANNPLSASLKGAYAIEKKSLQLSETTIGLKDIIGLKVQGSILHQGQDPVVDLLAVIAETPLNAVYRPFVKEPFGMQKPFLVSMNTGGSISADVRLTGTPSDLTAKGSFTWKDGELLSGDNSFSLQGIELDLPLWYQTGEGEVSEETAEGKLSVQSMIVSFLPEQPLNLPFDVGPNSLLVTSPTTVRIPGGDVIVGPVTCEDIFGTKRSVTTSLEITDIEINELLPGIWSSPLQGTIGGRLEPIYFEGGTLTSQGEVTGDAFGGQLILSGIGASRLSTSGPVFSFDAEWSGVSLAELTTDTTFGRVDGVLRGYVKGVEIAYGQPQAFDLLLETVKTKGVPQKISIIAVDNIAQIGGGASPFMGLAGQLASFFKEFPYTKIGVHASLQNDVFRINGTVKDGKREYLVKRGRFSGINVVNQSPDNRVSFKDMVKRIKRVTDSKSGPVTK
jgi:hypothetical protein